MQPPSPASLAAPTYTPMPSVPAQPRVAGIPAQLTSFVGRQSELDVIRRLFAGTRLLTLTGAGGSGKTRLAVEAIAREAAEGKDGAWVELSAVRDPALVPNAILETIGAREQSETQTPIERLTEFLGSRPYFLVLDNCEHLVDACAALVDVLLRHCPNLRVVATSREALGVTAETAWLVPSLSLPTVDDARAVSSEAVQLFVDRARAVLPGFELGDEHCAAVAKICRRLDGLPLALELAAARLRVLTPDQIASRLDDRFRLLKTGNRAALPRHQTLRAAIDWSYDLLEPHERLLLARLSVFGGGFTLEAAESVCAGGEIAPDDVLDLVSGLVEKSLVEMREIGESARYRMLETVRQYGAERLGELGDIEARQRLHFEYFFALAVEAEPNLTTPRRLEWVARLQAELDNIRQTLAWSREGDPELHMRLVGLLHWFWYATGQWPEARQWLKSALTTRVSDRQNRDRAMVLFSAGAIASLQARPESAQVHLVEAQAIARSIGDGRLEAYVRNYRAVAFGQIGSPEAGEHVWAAYAWLKEHNDLYGLRLNFLLQGLHYTNQGNLEAAVDAAQEGVRVARVFGLGRELAIALQTLGMTLVQQGDLPRATALFRESLEAMRHDPHLFFLSRSLEMLASSLVEQSAFAEAGTIYGSAEAIRETIGAKMWQLDKQRHSQRIEKARRAIGDEAFDTARVSGRKLGLQEAIDLALEAAARRDSFDEEEPTNNTAEYAAVSLPPRPATPSLRVLALGSLEVSVDGAPIAPKSWGYVKARELLVFLLCNPEGRTREQVGVALWPDASSAQVRNNFHVTVHHLRKALGRADWVRFDRDRYQIKSAGAIELDAMMFESQVTAALRSARQGADPVPALQAALSLFRGEFAESEPFGDWSLEIRDRLTLLHAQGLDALGNALLKAERFDDAAATFERLIRQEELHEEAYVSLMLCRARAGDRTAAMREYRRLESVFQRELGSKPSAETATLFRKLQRGEAV